VFIQGIHSPATEREARGYRWLWPGVPSAPVVAIEKRQAFVVQEQPWHPGSFFQSGVRPVGIIVVEKRQALVVQEQPWHPGSFFWSGVKPVNVIFVAPGITNSIYARQEQPWHPGSFVGIPALPPAAPWRERRHWITTVEQPWHPGSWVWAPQPPTFVQAGRRIWQTTTEQPWHPGAFTWSRPPTSIPPFINAGRSAGLLVTRVEQPWHPQSFINGPNTLPSGSPLGFGKRRPLFLASQGGFPASYWPDANG
jgi:hypothetical protein